MIYVKRDFSQVPQHILERAREAHRKLESLPPDERAEFINDHREIWKAFKPYLSAMSHGKCWYSESPIDQTFHDVDHFRPKLKARRSETEFDRGYEWLAFAWDNFRLSAQRSNRLSTNENTGGKEGKADWFPLLDGSPKACWDDRCEAQERPVMLDPAKREDVRLLQVEADGRVGPSRFCYGTNRTRVEASVRILGLDLPNLKAARLRVMREVASAADVLLDTLTSAKRSTAFANASAIGKMSSALERRTWPDEPYAAAARAQLRFLGLGELCATPEETGV